MSETKAKKLLTLLTEEQQKILYETYIQQKTKQQEVKQHDIAIIGLSGRYPQADNHYTFWSKLQQGTNFIEEVPVSRWDHSKYYDPKVGKSFIPHKTRCKFGAFLKAHDTFDASFFNLHPDEVVLMDPQERLALETTWSCIEDAGYVPTRLGKNVGLFSGLTYSEYQKLIPLTSHSYMLNNRIAYFFNFQGPTLTIDAGCCSSLVAIHQACQNLIRKECQTAIVIGANIILHPDHYTSLSPMLSLTNKPYSNPFGIDDGWIPAEGVVSVLLKPLKQALQDKDHVYATIKSSHVRQEGKTSWFMAFNPKQQAKLIKENFKKSGISPETISYVEAAASGSSLGDAIELEGLTTAFNQFTRKNQFCPIGTVKSNIGHGEGVSTLLQLTKVLLQFKSKMLIPLINLKATNPNIKVENTPFYFQKSIQKWKPPTLKINQKLISLPRRATISSFGAGGSIGHLILEEHTAENVEQQRLDAYFIPVSSKTVVQLKQTIKNYIDFFEKYQKFDSEGESNYTLLNIMFTLCTGRVPFQERVVFIAENLQILIKQFQHFLSGNRSPNIILNKEDTLSKTVNNNQAQIQSYIQNQSWHNLAQLWVCGIDISWETFFNSFNVQRIPLPTYSFQKQSSPLQKPENLKSNKLNFITKAMVSTENHTNNIINDNTGSTPKVMKSKIDQVNELFCHNVGNDNEINNIFIKIFSNILDLDSDKIDLLLPLDKYGFNSTMVISVSNELEMYFSTVPKTLFFECQTIQEIINYFVKEFPEEIRMIIQEKQVDFEQVSENKVEFVVSQLNDDKFNSEYKEISDEELIEDLTKAILSDSISAEMLLKKL